MANLSEVKWFVLRYGVPFVGFGAFLAGIFFIFQGLILQRELVEKESRISVWFLAQANIEFLRFTESLKDYVIEPGPGTAKVATERFEIFWSRLPPLLEGSQTADLRALDGVVSSTKAMIAALEELEPDMARLEALTPAGVDTINDRLDELRAPLHDLVRRALLYESNEVNRGRARHEELYQQLLGLFVLTLMVGLVIFGLLFRQIVKTNNAVIAKDLAAKQAITARNELELAINSIFEGFIIYDQEDRVALFNRRYVDLHPMQADQMALGVSFEDLLRAAVRNGGIQMPADQVDGWVASILAKRRETVETTFESRLSDGHWLRISERRASDGRLVSVHTDISDLKERERLIQQKSELLQTTLDNMKQGIAVFDAEATLVLFNNQYLTINQYPTGFPRLSTPYSELAGFAAGRGDLGSGDQAALVSSQVAAIERVMRTRSGSLRQQRRLGDGRVVETIVSALPTGGFVKTYEDISDRIASQAERAHIMEMYHAAQKTQALGTLAGGIAHDFNNIIGSIIGNCALLISDLPDGDPGYVRLRQIMDSGTRARDLVRQILTYSRNAESDRKALALNMLIEESLATLRPLMPRNVALQVENIEPCHISGDATQIHQVMLNVCVNAGQAIGERQGRIKVSVQRVDVTAADLPGLDHTETHGSRPGAPTRGQVGALREGTYARVSIIDTGSGIPEEVMPRIFEPFYTTKEVGHGTGLGLAAVQGVIRNHEGAVCIESLSGVGTRVDVYFPATELPVLAARPEAPRPPALTASERLLLIDDDRVLLSVTKEILMRLGYTVDAYNDPEQALEVFRADPDAWDLVITDRSMPILNGEDLARALKGLRPSVPVLMLSGFVSSEDVERLSELGIGEVVGKPILPDELANVVRDVLGRAADSVSDVGARSAGAA